MLLGDWPLRVMQIDHILLCLRYTEHTSSFFVYLIVFNLANISQTLPKGVDKYETALNRDKTNFQWANFMLIVRIELSYRFSLQRVGTVTYTFEIWTTLGFEILTKRRISLWLWACFQAKYHYIPFWHARYMHRIHLIHIVKALNSVNEHVYNISEYSSATTDCEWQNWKFRRNKVKYSYHMTHTHTHTTDNRIECVQLSFLFDILIF